MNIPWMTVIKEILTLLFICHGFVSLHAQTSGKLPATTVIGTELSVDYADNNSPSTTVNTIHNAFDGTRKTFFASYERSGTWVGLDLGEAHVITKIGYAPRNYVDGPKRLLLGIFEGANDPGFLDAIPLLMITEMPENDTITTQPVDCSKGFRYVRYIGPNDARCNIAEIEFYGYKGVGDHSYLPQLTNLPTVVIHTADAEAIENRDEYVNGAISIIYDDGKSLFQDGLGIRGRGHSSWGFPKKPYRIKLFNKTNLLGSPAKARNWTLLSNYGDKTLMRNMLAFDLARWLDMDFSSVGIPVDLILNGEYQGTYELSDQIEVDPGRVDIEEMTNDDIAEPDITGGYLLEIDGYAYQEQSWFLSRRGTPVRTRYPSDDDIVDEQYQYIWNHFNKMEDAIFAPNYKDPDDGYRKYIDIESFIRHFLVGEISGNTDTYWSTYLYKQRNQDAFKFGPVWDFDLAFENYYGIYPTNYQSQWVYQSGTGVKGMRDLINRLFNDVYLVNKLKAVYAGYRDSGVLSKESFLNLIDGYAAAINQSQQYNFMRWNIMNRLVHGNPVIHGSYEAEVNNVKSFISGRIDWMDHKLNYEPPSGNNFTFAGLSTIIIYAQEKSICLQQIPEAVTVSIYDLNGKTVVSKTIRSDEKIPVPQGMYFVIVADTKGNKKTSKCMVY